jgi:riboflavin synthase
MFTGIVTEQGVVSSVKSNKGYSSISIKCSKKFLKGLKKGASVSVNGVCLTSKKGSSEMLRFDVIDETLSLTNLKQIKKGTKVNLERSMTVKTEIGGHLLSGHIHCEGTISKITKVSNQTKDMLITLPSKMMKYIFYKGYIGINGCSLTIGKVNKNSFFIHLIPETLKITNLDELSEKSKVNIEIEQSTLITVESVEKIIAQKKV